MIKTGIAVVVLLVATVWLPIWIQIPMYVGAVFLVPYQAILFIPALFADALYAPFGGISFGAHLYGFSMAGLLLVRWVLVHKTRIGVLYYGVEA